MLRSALALFVLLAAAGCQLDESPEGRDPGDRSVAADAPMTMEQRVAQYTTFRLTADLSGLSDNQRQMLPLLIEAAQVMDSVFWTQSYGDDWQDFLAGLDGPEAEYARINYGPWDRLADNAPFLDGVGPKPMGAAFYPADADTTEIAAAAAANPDILSLYTLVRRDSAGALVAIPYHVAYRDQHERAARLLREAAALADDPGFQRYLTLRAEALLTGDYQPSDFAWMAMRENDIEFVVGPIETYEDGLYGAKAAHEAYVLIKDQEWTARLARYAQLLPQLQANLPVEDAYKQDEIGTNADLGAYDVIYYAGDSNAGSKTIAINLPNDEVVQQQAGSRRLQLKNAMQAKFDEILEPIAGELIDASQREHVTFDAFFANTMFHEVAHGLGIKNVIDGSGTTVREALRDQASALEEGKADVLGLYMVQQLAEGGELGDDHDLMDNYVTFMASIFRSIRFGGSSAHGKANLLRFNFFREMGAFERTDEGTYRVVPERMAEAVDALAGRILTLQGDGDYDAVNEFVTTYGEIGPQLQLDLDRLAAAGIPVDVVFEQGLSVLGLDD